MAIFVIEYVVFFEWLRESVQVSYCLFTFDTVVIGDYHEEGEGWDSIYHFKPEHIFVPCSKRGSGFP